MYHMHVCVKFYIRESSADEQLILVLIGCYVFFWFTVLTRKRS